MTKDELIAAIRQTPLTEEDFQEILGAVVETMMAHAFMGLGLDLASGGATTGTMPAGRWERHPGCSSVHPDTEAGFGWRGAPGSSKHEHWVES